MDVRGYEDSKVNFNYPKRMELNAESELLV
jgi:hypothetical protein